MNTQELSQAQKKETKQLTELLAFIYLALKNIQIYPAGHSLVKNRLIIAHQHLSRLLGTRNTILFGVARNVITFNERPIGEDSQACSALAKILSSHEIASFSFSHGISKHSLLQFLKTVGVLPEQNQSGKTLGQELSTLNLSHINVEFINYNYLDRSSKKDSGTDTGEPLTWLSFTRKLTSGVLGYSENDEETNSGNRSPSPEALAAAINRHAARQPEIIMQFATLLDQTLKDLPQEQSSPASFGGRELDQILVSLNPKIREQFINTTLERCDQNIRSGTPEKILESFSNSVVLEMVQQINKKNVRVSPALINLVRKISTIRSTPGSTTSAATARQKNVSNLLNPESYNKHVGSDYHDTLQHLAKSSPSPDILPEAFPLDQHLESLSEDHLNRQIVRVTLLLMEQTVNEKEYEALAARLMETCLVLPDTGTYELLVTTAKTLQQQATAKGEPLIRKTAGKCLEQLTALDFLDYIYSILPEATEQERENAIELFKLFCPGIIDKLLKIFCMKPMISEEDPLVPIFRTFRLDALKQIFTLLPKTTTSNMRKLLTLVGYLGLQGTVRLLHPFLDNEDPDIRMQVLNLLLPINDNEAIATLIAMLKSENEHTINTAIELCTTHNPPACVPSLLNLLEYQFVKQASIERNRKLFMILSHIGDARALPCLEKIAFTKWLFHREQITNMKRILFYSLKGYKNKDRMELVKKGMQIDDTEIHKICEALLPVQ
ncbi:hypothetical protein UWK_00371 [Desulfocapsa sulfexigens DSM 10523]|uniref:HEAT repeat-containing protein n=1 Tax=Desulfocapsa sulfexigens (strain DSM 10523 / SB164P1) TaxID=1167006 RepID=M1PKE0_DESSD|nr:HEAT repeat domain-containing protein [Desulfocapsa sulfexigens]AGF76956.1 hypothetical protein UWK_00371 [Desulfocapsa sulfexigens DSM 10523]